MTKVVSPHLESPQESADILRQGALAISEPFPEISEMLILGASIIENLLDMIQAQHEMIATIEADGEGEGD